jgi:hypothetical protein
VTGFTASFTLEAAFLVVAVIAGILIPTAVPERPPAAAAPEFATVQEAG